jgi:DNA-binding MarR family transcriptional regulator
MTQTVEPVESPCVCATLRMATRAVARVYDRALETHSLRTTQYSILSRLEVEGPVGIGQLAARLAMDRTTLAREAEPLVRAGLVERASGQDRRRRVLSLTPEGLARLEAARPAWKDAQRIVRDRLGYDRTQELLGELRVLLAAVRSAPP